MSIAGTDGFADALADLDVTLVRTTEADAPGAIADLLRGDTVGVEPDCCSLPESVNTDPTREEIETADTGVTPAALGVAEFGSVLVHETGRGEERASLHPRRHVAVLAASDLEPDLNAALPRIAEAASSTGSAVLTTGPSATADMGGLVVGAHGPETVAVVLVEDA